MWHVSVEIYVFYFAVSFRRPAVFVVFFMIVFDLFEPISLFPPLQCCAVSVFFFFFHENQWCICLLSLVLLSFIGMFPFFHSCTGPCRFILLLLSFSGFCFLLHVPVSVLHRACRVSMMLLDSRWCRTKGVTKLLLLSTVSFCSFFSSWIFPASCVLHKPSQRCFQSTNNFSQQHLQ